jgi:low affinity Fe/Cu permease
MNRTAQLVLVVLLILFLVGTLPMWPYSSGWGYYPVGGVGFLLIVVLVVLALGARDGRRLQ